MLVPLQVMSMLFHVNEKSIHVKKHRFPSSFSVAFLHSARWVSHLKTCFLIKDIEIASVCLCENRTKLTIFASTYILTIIFPLRYIPARGNSGSKVAQEDGEMAQWLKHKLPLQKI